jgi:hypothetical protein
MAQKRVQLVVLAVLKLITPLQVLRVIYFEAAHLATLDTKAMKPDVTKFALLRNTDLFSGA